MQMNTRPQDVLAVSRWLTLDELDPSGRELLVVVKKEQGSPHSFFITRKTSGEAGEPPRFFAGWVHDMVLIDAARTRPGVNLRDREVATQEAARSALRAFLRDVEGDDEAFEEAFAQAAKLARAMRERDLI